MLKDSRGSIAVGFALSLVPILGLVAALVEYSRVIGVRTELNALADRATLAAAIAIDPRRSDTWVRGTPDPRPIMQNAFEQAALERAGASNASLTATYTVETVDGVPEVRICYEVVVPTIIGEFIDKGNITATNCVTARSAAPTFTNIHVMIDASGSMGACST